MQSSTHARHWLAIASQVVRRRFALAAAPALALLGVLVAPALPAEAAFSCHYSISFTSINVSDPGGNFTLTDLGMAGWYSGLTVQPSSTGVTAAGKEAQCLLAEDGFSPGTIDGIFGSQSQAAALAFQKHVNAQTGARIGQDGLVGPQTWPWLRCYSPPPCIFTRH